MELVFGQDQMATSSRMQKHPWIAKLAAKTVGYTNLGNYARSTVFKKLIEKLPWDKFEKVLDLGCGYGEYSLMLAKYFPAIHFTALDIDSDRINSVKQAIKSSSVENVSVFNDYLEKAPDHELDFIYSVDVFEHIDPKQMPFHTCNKKLKKGGYLLVKMPNISQKTIMPEGWFEEHQDWLEDEHIGQVYDLRNLEARFKMEGFEIVHSSYSDGWLSRLGWELAYLGKKAGFIGQATSLMTAKLLVKIDRLIHRNNWGNAIQVIGKKV